MSADVRTIWGISASHPDWPLPTVMRVKLSLSDNVWEIREQAARQLGRPHAEIVIWKLQNPVEQSDKQKLFDSRRTLPYIATAVEPAEVVSEIFEGPYDGTTLVFVAGHADPPGNDRKRKGEETTSQYYKRIRSLQSPSALAKDYRQSSTNPVFLNHRPFEAEGIPTELMHPVFGRFRDHCLTGVPLQSDIELTLDMCQKMSQTYPYEEDRLKSFMAVIKEHYDVDLHGVSIGRAITDATAIHGPYYSFNVEAKNMVGASGDPYIQNTAYYAKKVAATPSSELLRLPIILVDVTGPLMTISGAINGSKIITDPYIVINLAIPSHDISNLVPVFAALHKAILELRDYYTSTPLPTLTDEQRRFPYFNRFEDVEFLYHDCLDPDHNRLLFVAGTTSTSPILTPGSLVVVKFSRTYGTAAQIATAELGFAPKIYHYERLPGGWTVVVMEQIIHPYKLLRDMSNADRAALRPALVDAVTKMHAAGFVHGDLRRGNIFGDVQSRSIKIIDWDWAGKAEEVKYPILINLKVPRDPDVGPSRPITKAHDRTALNLLLDDGPVIPL